MPKECLCLKCHIRRKRKELDVIVPWDGETIYIDLETIGLKQEDRIIEITMIDGAGDIFLNTLIDPGIPIPPEATKVNRITDAMVAGAPKIEDFSGLIFDILNGQRLVTYNAEFDTRYLPQDAVDATSRIDCASRQFAARYSGWSTKYGAFKTMKLATAMRLMEGKWRGDPHRALADTYACRDIWLHLESGEDLPAFLEKGG